MKDSFLLTSNIYNIGVNDHNIDLFESQYVVKNGMRYNSYVIIDDKIAVIDTIDKNFKDEWLNKLGIFLDGKKPDYLIIHHMEPDHSANIVNFMKKYPATTVVSSARAFQMMTNFFGDSFDCNKIVVSDNDVLELGKHKLRFVSAQMVHWPEVIMSYEECSKTLFSADAFGKFGANDIDEPWLDEARRYYYGIVGKFGIPVQSLLKKIASLDIKMICSLHGPVIKDNLSYYLDLYNTWSKYLPEENGVCICYTSVYGNTRDAVMKLKDELNLKGIEVVSFDLARCDMYEAVANAFKYDRLVLATTTYNSDIFPYMRHFINHLTSRGFNNRKVGLIENGSWAITAIKVMKQMLEACNNLTYVGEVHIKSSLNDVSLKELDELLKNLL